MVLAITLLILGFAILIVGAEVLVRGAASIASKLKIPSIVVGLTVVSFGTSAPELIVNLYSAFQGASDLAVGNVIGSNIANVLLILGVSAIIFPLRVKRGTTWKEIPFAFLAMILLYFMANDSLIDGASNNVITRSEGFSLMAMFMIFMYYTFGLAKAQGESEKIREYPHWLSTIFVVLGIAGLFYGGNLLVNNAIFIAKVAGLSEALIGLTIVAIGTSLPEMATSIIAAIHKHDDIAIGNIVGSNIFNVFWILGLTASILQLPFNPITNVDLLVGVATTSLLFLFMFVGKKHELERWQGALMVASYMGYIGFLVYRG